MGHLDADANAEADDEADATQIEPPDLGTEAASPHALAHAADSQAAAPDAHGADAHAAGLVGQLADQAVGHSSGHAIGSQLGARRTLTSQRPGFTAADALDRGDLPRMRAFHLFGISAPLAAIGLSLLMGGDPFARGLFWIGALMLSISNIGLVWLTGSTERYQSGWVSAFWMIATTGVTPALYYFGPFSAVVMVQMLGIVFIALGRSRRNALATAAICIGTHLAVSIPIMFGWIRDVGVLTSTLAHDIQLVVAEALIVAFLASGYLLGRWARRTSATALAELDSARRLIGDQQQALAEVKDDAARARQINEGRWTGHHMGRWKLGLVLGRGAMGEVYEATHTDGRGGAVKLLNARSTASTSHVERFHREMAVAARLDSPYIVRVFDISPADAPVPYLAMERLYGIDLATKLRTDPRMPSDELVVLLDQVARGLEVARTAGVIHRDLKPHNLFCHDGATWKILDFGVSKLLGDEGTLTGEGGIVGTPQYMAPEQASGGQITHLADVYALGAIAYRCLTGRSPFKGQDIAELVYQVVHTPPVRPGALGRVSVAIEDVLAIAMAKDPRRRFSSALSFAQAFVAARRGKQLALEVPPNAWS